MQDIDGGFFEKFGSLLRHKSQLDEPESTQLAPFIESRIGEEDDFEVITDENSNLEATPMSAMAFAAPVPEGTETEEPGSGASSESEDNETKIATKEEFIIDAVGMNVSVYYLFIFFLRNFKNWLFLYY